MNYKRDLELDKMYLKMAHLVSKQSKCKRRKVGALIVREGNILSYGYNGTPTGMCNTCEDEQGKTKPEVLHAESNALMKLCKGSSSSTGATLYVTTQPCIHCAKLILQSGITEVIYEESYHSTDGVDLLIANKISCYPLNVK